MLRWSFVERRSSQQNLLKRSEVGKSTEQLKDILFSQLAAKVTCFAKLHLSLATHSQLWRIVIKLIDGFPFYIYFDWLNKNGLQFQIYWLETILKRNSLLFSEHSFFLLLLTIHNQEKQAANTSSCFYIWSKFSSQQKYAFLTVAFSLIWSSSNFFSLIWSSTSKI